MDSPGSQASGHVTAMTLAEQITWKLTAVAAGLVLVAGAGIWATLVTRRDAELVRLEYERMGLINDAAVTVRQTTALIVVNGIAPPGKTAHDAEMSTPAESGWTDDEVSEASDRLERAKKSIMRALSNLDRLASDVADDGPAAMSTRKGPEDQQDIDESKRNLMAAHDLLNEALDDPSSFDIYRLAEPLSDARRALSGLINRSGRRVEFIHDRNSNWIRTATITVITLSGLVMLGVVGLSVWQYRSVIRPIERLRTGVHRIAAGDFDHRLDATGCAEFVALSNDFNRTAGELRDVYADLETRVRATSKKLARAEQLASVGYLAAAVSHEINNPIGIMAGYAESALRIAGRQPDNTVPAEVTEALEIVRDEAFRCKKITGQLLSLARGPDQPVAEVSIADLVREVVTMLRGLTKYADRRIEVNLADGDPLTIRSSALEIKQALLNVAVNALDAVAPNTGVVTFEGRAQNGAVRVTVRDNGRGMTPAVIDKVFEPFFSTRRSGEGHGVGLGMSITQAIIERGGGHITAESAGPGRGSTFTIILPDRRDTPAGSTA